LRQPATIPHVKNVRRICYAGTYERDYPRNRLIVQAARDLGVRVEECHVPVFERTRDKSGAPAMVLLTLSLRLTMAYLRLIPDVGLRMLRCDTLMIGYIGQLDVLVLGTLARMMRRKVVFNPLVSLTDTLVEDRRRFSETGAAGRFIRWIDRAAFGRADLVLVDTEENAAFFSDSFGIDRQRIGVVQVGAPAELFYPVGPPNERGSVLDVLFVGKFIPLHGVETILRAAALLQERHAPVRIEMIGRGQDYKPSRELAERLSLANVTWRDWIPFERLGDRIREADVALGIFDDGAKAARVVPNKVHQALACGTALVTCGSPAIDRFLTHRESAMLVPPSDPHALADVIEHLLDDRLRRQIGDAGHASWLQWGSPEMLARQLDEALNQLAEAS
jgi:glycosyltransferase involved in cell wall biosynthesis